MKKGIGIQWHMRYAPKKYSIGAERVDNQVGSGDICGVWRVQLQRHQDA